MPSYKVKVKWGRENYDNIECNTDEHPILFKAQLYALTGVQPERQKVMCKGIALKDDEWNMAVKEGGVILLLGSKEEVPLEPQEKTKFIEDMTENELATVMELPSGLINLGNTCYMNATVQCLHACPELREALKSFKAGYQNHSVSAHSITAALRVVFESMNNYQNSAVTPISLLQALHTAFPQFAQTGENGAYRQQDANECWSELLKMLQQKLPAIKPEGTVSETSPSSFIDQYFGGTFDVEMKCSEAPDEPSTYSKENFLQLSCFISQEVRYMQGGLKSKMREQITKMSNTLGRDALYTRSSLISRLPAYLTVNFVRFQYKGKEGINAKVLKDIKFPIDFDAFDLCTPELQKRLTPMRTQFKTEEDANLLRVAKLKDLTKAERAVAEKEKPKTMTHPYHFENDLGSNNSGFYTLWAVLTHQGRSSSSGHYVAWVRQSGDKWMKFDDDDVSPITSEDVLRLSGGGDWHCAYVLLYGPKILETPIEDKMEE